MKILIADGNPRVRSFIKELLQNNEIQFVEASNGLMCIDNFLFHNPDVIVMSLRMKVMDGIEATEIIRRNSNSVSIIVLYDDENEKLLEKVFSAGASECFSKANLTDFRNYINTNKVMEL